MSAWLDTETKALLQQSPPGKLAPPDTATFTLVLLEKGPDPTRLMWSLARVPGRPKQGASAIVLGACPVLIVGGLSLSDAVLGQFELICGDSISVFLRDEVVLSATADYLNQLYAQFRHSQEFEEVTVHIASVPGTDQGKRFGKQFLGNMAGSPEDTLRNYPLETQIMRKKARIMVHWARKIGAKVAIAGDN